MNTIIIPARFASTRFPGKPLALINGVSMIQRVYTCALSSELAEKVIIATDDERIAEHVQSFGAIVEMTSPHHATGTDRIIEVVNKISEPIENIINIQGDEPFIKKEQIDSLFQFLNHIHDGIVTYCKKILSYDDLQNPNIVKVVKNSLHEALYFSRQPIPYNRNKDFNDWVKYYSYMKHLGIYGFKTKTLQSISKLSPSLLENTEQLEQLRWLDAGFKIHVIDTEFQSIAIDTPEDIITAEKYIKENYSG